MMIVGGLLVVAAGGIVLGMIVATLYVIASFWDVWK
jgi:hypothetical protein